MTEQEIQALGYALPRQLPDGRWIAVQRMLYTTSLFVGIDAFSWSTRYCYERTGDAIVDLLRWDGEGDPPGPWVKHKGHRVDRLNPRLKDEVF